MYRQILTWCVASMMVCGEVAAQDAGAVLQAAAAAMGADRVQSLRISGTGMVGAVGQSYSSLEPSPVLNAPDDDWPRFEVTSYTRTIDYAARYSREELTRRQGNNRARGGGGTPLQGEQRRVLVVNGAEAWNEQDSAPVAAPADAEVRQLDIWLTPHGFLKAALASDSRSAITRPLGNRTVTIVSFEALGKYRVNGTINEQHLVEHVQTWVANPVLGDMLYETRYSNYRDYGGVKFPTVLHSHQGDFGLYPADNSQEIRVTGVEVNPSFTPVPPPAGVRGAAVPPVTVEPVKVANGVWLLAGGSHHSLLVEFRDFVAVVEAPQHEARSLAVIATVRTLVPAKPIRYVVNTHVHFDHSGGLRTYVAEGAVVVTHERNRAFYQNVVLRPGLRMLQPDRLSRFPRAATLETLSQRYVLSDGDRTLELHAIQGLAHSLTMVVAYLPKERLLVNADLYSPPAAGAVAPAPTASMRTLYQNMQRLGLDVERHVPLHGGIGTGSQFVQLMQAAAN